MQVCRQLKSSCDSSHTWGLVCSHRLVEVLVSTFTEGRKSTAQKFAASTSEDEVNFGDIGGVGKGQVHTT